MCKCFIFQTLLLPKVLTRRNTLSEGSQMIDMTKGLWGLL